MSEITKMAEQRMILFGHIKKYSFYWKAVRLPASSVRFMLFISYEMHSQIVLLHFLEWKGIVRICIPDNTRAEWARSLSGTKEVS